MIFGYNAKPSASNKDQDGLFSSLKSGLVKTKTNLFSGFNDLLSQKKIIDDDLIMELEDHLLMADVGVDATGKIISDLRGQIKKSRLDSPEKVRQALAGIMLGIIHPDNAGPVEGLQLTGKPSVLLMVGVNGAGKTTTAGKLANQLQAEGKSVMFAAGDTFRAAAIEQLQAWGQRNDIPVIAQAQGSDASAVIFDALQAAKARNIDVLIADTAGRLHNQANLMEELIKISRTITKFDANIGVERLLVVDAGAGQNVLAQVKQFDEAIGINGIILTKLDGTARGGIIFALSMLNTIPVKYIGLGEKIDDLQRFNPVEFVNALIEPEQ